MRLLKKDGTAETVAIIWVLAAWATLCITYEAASRTFDAIRGKKKTGSNPAVPLARKA